MNTIPVEVYGVLAYLLLCAGIAILTRRTRSFSEFSVGGRQVPAAMIFASVATTYIGPGFSVGFIGKGFATGYTFYLLALTYAVQTILVGLFFAPRLAQFRDCYTIGDVMERRYGKAAQLLSGIISVGLCVGFTAIMGKIAGQLLHTVTGLPLSVSIAAVTMFTAVYTFTGGVRAVIANDGIQFLAFTVIIPFLLLLAFFKSPVSAAEVAAQAADLTRSGLTGLTGIQILGIALAFLLGETLTPPYANRALAAKSAAESRQGFVIAGVFCVIWLGICATLGVFARQFLPADTMADNALLAIGQQLLPAAVYGILLAAVVAIVMSSQESVLNSASVSLVKDIIGIRGNLNDRTELILSRIATLALAATAVIVAQYAPSIIEGLLICYSIWAPGLLLPFLLGLYVKRTKPMAGWLSMLVGAATSIIWQTVLKEPGGIPAILVGLAASGLGYIIGQMFGPANTIREGDAS